MQAIDKVIRLAKALGFETREQYYDYLVETHVNGQFDQCRRLFKKLPPYFRHEAIEYMRENHITVSREFYIKLL